MTADLFSDAVDLTRTADFDLGGLKVRPSLREVQGHGPAERLEPRVMQALVALAERPGAVVSRNLLIERCWDGRIVGDDAINRCMAKLRRVGGAHGAFAIEAIPRIGYRLIVTTGGGDKPDVARGWASRRTLWALLACALLLGVAGIAWLAWPRGLSAQTPFVVTAFRTATPDEASRTFAKTAADAVAGALAQHRLPTRATWFDPSLNIEALVDDDGAELHARVRMVDRPSRTTIWTGDFSGPVAESATLRTRIAARVTAAAQAAQDALKFKSHDFDAGSLALAVQGIDGVETNSWSTLTNAEALTKRSPDYGPGHIALGGNLLVASVLGPPDQADTVRARAVAETHRGLALCPECFLGKMTLMWSTDATHWAERDRVFSSTRDPDDFWVKLARGELMLNAGRVNAGAVLLGQAVDGREMSGFAGPRAQAQRLAGRPDQAGATLRYALMVRPNDESARRVQLDLSAASADPDATLAILDDPGRRPAGLSVVGQDAYRALARWRKSRSSADLQATKAAIGLAVRTQSLPRYTAVPLLVDLGDLDGAFDLAKAYALDPRVRFSAMYFDPSFLFLPETAPMRRDPRFIEVARALGLIGYWRSSGVWPDFCQTEPESVCAAMKAG